MTSSVPVGNDDVLFPVETADMVAPTPPEWVRVHSAALRCDRCASEVAAARGHAPRPALAKWRHRVPGVDELLCYPHARTAREEGNR